MANRKSLYWDDFEKRVDETVQAVKNNSTPPVRRVAVFITEKCNLNCDYCNVKLNTSTMKESTFYNILEKYGETAIIHITGGEPSTVKWLYPTIKVYGKQFKFHLNTNAIIEPPAEHVRRLKISLDGSDAEYWDSLVGREGAFDTVVDNIKKSIPKTTVSITFTLTKENYTLALAFAQYANREFPGLYALFFSIYKGTNPRFKLDEKDADIFFNNILPLLKKELPEESLALIEETIDEKRRLIQGIRFEQDMTSPCYLSMSEIVVGPSGEEFTCSHLYRDGIFNLTFIKNEKCRYGCNQRLVKFNEDVKSKLI